MKKQFASFGILIVLLLPLALTNTNAGALEYVATVQVNSTIVSGYVSENTTWTLEGSPYIIVEDIIVEPDVFLIIEPGVFVKFERGTNLIIDGSLIAQGNRTHKINFTSNAVTPAPNDWEAIRAGTIGKRFVGKWYYSKNDALIEFTNETSTNDVPWNKDKDMDTYCRKLFHPRIFYLTTANSTARRKALRASWDSPRLIKHTPRL